MFARYRCTQYLFKLFDIRFLRTFITLTETSAPCNSYIVIQTRPKHRKQFSALHTHILADKSACCKHSTTHVHSAHITAVRSDTNRHALECSPVVERSSQVQCLVGSVQIQLVVQGTAQQRVEYAHHGLSSITNNVHLNLNLVIYFI